jgi:AcrR family transcriptional regulator
MAAPEPRTSTRTPRDAVHAEVLAAVERLLGAGERFTTLGVQRICDEAGVARSAFYVNFADKSDLLVKLMTTATSDVMLISEEWLAAEPMLGPDALAAAQARVIGVFREHAPLLSAYAEVAAYDEQVAAFWRTRLEAVVALTAARIQTGQRTGEVRPELDPDTCARLIVLGGERLMRDHVAADDGAGDERFARGLSRSVWFMLHGP